MSLSNDSISPGAMTYILTPTFTYDIFSPDKPNFSDEHHLRPAILSPSALLTSFAYNGTIFNPAPSSKAEAVPAYLKQYASASPIWPEFPMTIRPLVSPLQGSSGTPSLASSPSSTSSTEYSRSPSPTPISSPTSSPFPSPTSSAASTPPASPSLPPTRCPSPTPSLTSTTSSPPNSPTPSLPPQARRPTPIPRKQRPVLTLSPAPSTGPWTVAENAACIALMRRVCASPTYAGREARYDRVAQLMRSEHGFHRRNVKNQWNRYLRSESGVEDRVKARGAGLVTSSLRPVKRKRGITVAEETEEDGDVGVGCEEEQDGEESSDDEEEEPVRAPKRARKVNATSDAEIAETLQKEWGWGLRSRKSR